MDRLTAKLVNHLTAMLVNRLTAALVNRLTAKLMNRLTAKLLVVNLVKLHLTKLNTGIYIAAGVIRHLSPKKSVGHFFLSILENKNPFQILG